MKEIDAGSPTINMELLHEELVTALSVTTEEVGITRTPAGQVTLIVPDGASEATALATVAAHDPEGQTTAQAARAFNEAAAAHMATLDYDSLLTYVAGIDSWAELQTALTWALKKLAALTRASGYNATITDYE